MDPLTIASLLVSLALLVGVVLFVARPLLRPQPLNSAPPSLRSQLEQRKVAILDEIRALDFDYETKKIPQEAYEPQRAVLLAEAADTLQALDELPEAPASDDVVAQINDAIAALRSRPAPVVDAGQTGGAYCTQCGATLDEDDRFCARCGQPVRVPQPTT